MQHAMTTDWVATRNSSCDVPRPDVVRAAALVLIDACVRLLPGVMGNDQTVSEESFTDGLLEYPHYTRPALWRDGEEREWSVPEVLVSGHHEKVKAWRRAEAERLTRERRPDLWSRYRGAGDRGASDKGG